MFYRNTNGDFGKSLRLEKFVIWFDFVNFEMKLYKKQQKIIINFNLYEIGIIVFFLFYRNKNESFGKSLKLKKFKI